MPNVFSQHDACTCSRGHGKIHDLSLINQCSLSQNNGIKQKIQMEPRGNVHLAVSYI